MSSNTSKYACPKCKNPNHNKLDKNLYSCQECGYEWSMQTLFDQLTASPEVLAEKLVYAVHYGGLYFWHSTLIYPAFPFETKEEAIAATVAMLKEVCDE